MSDWLKFDPLAKSGGMDLSGPADTVLSIFKAGVNGYLRGANLARMKKERREEQKRQEELLHNPPPVHGSARWATATDLLQAKLLQPFERFDSPSSLVLGVLAAGDGKIDGQIHWDGEGHLMTVAPTRSGKSTTVIIPNLVRYHGSCIVLDPKGELYAQTATWRAANVGPVYRIAPFSRDTHAFNPLSAIRTPADARALADLMIPTDPRAQEFFKKDAVAFLSALIMHLLTSAPKEFQTMSELRRLTAMPLPDFREVLEVMAESSVSAVANAANIVLGKSNDRGLPSLRETLSNELALWDDPGVTAATASAEVDFRALKEQPATVYITVPFDKTDAYAPFLKVLLSTALEAMVQNEHKPAIPVLFILDEFLSLGPFPKFRDAIRTHAGAGVRLWFFLQDVPTLEEHYPSSWKAFFNSTVKIFFGTDEAFTGEMISKHLGDRTVAYSTGSLGMNRTTSTNPMDQHHSGRADNISQSVSLTGRPLLKPDEVVQLLSGAMEDGTRHGLTFIRNAPPIKMVMVPWFVGKTCKQRVQQISH